MYGKFDIRTYGGTGGGNMSLRQATLKSDNSVYIQLAMDLGPDEVKKTARDMGITSTLKGYPAETLGGLENGVSPLEMATAYASIASRRLPPAADRDQEDRLPGRARREGQATCRRASASSGPRSSRTASPPRRREILEQNIQGGTGTHATIGCPAAGKTGTTDNNTDAWFVGFTPRLTTAVWVGYPKDDIQMNGLYFGRNVDGGTFPADIWGDYMRRVKGGFCGDFAAAHAPVPGRRRSTAGTPRSGGELIGGDPRTSRTRPRRTDATTRTPSTGTPTPDDQTGETAPDAGRRGGLRSRPSTSRRRSTSRTPRRPRRRPTPAARRRPAPRPG